MKVRKMKRLRILILALCVCLIAGVAETLNMVDAYGEGEEGTTVTSHTHCICGDTDCNRTTTEHSNVTFGNVLTSNNSGELLCNDKEVTKDNGHYYTLDEGSYYLNGDVTISNTIKVTGTVNLCLNGKMLTGNYGSCIYIEEEATLNICDCQGNGEITNGTSDSNTISVGEQNCTPSNKTLNLYGGKISNTGNSGQTIQLYNNDTTGKTVIFNMYGGEVYKTSGQAVSASQASIGKGKYEINIYDGIITCTNGRGIDASGSKEARTLIAGGTIQGGTNALWVLGDTTLEGTPEIKCTSGNNADIAIITSSAVSEHDYLIIKDGFIPANEKEISIFKSVDESGSVVIAQPEKSTYSLESTAQYFVSAQEGYFVDYIANGNLQLTACEIKQQPTTSDCKVTANGNSADKVEYQWYSATRENTPVTKNNVKDTGGCSYWNEKWDYHTAVRSQDKKNINGFSLQMAKGDVLTMAFESVAVQSIEVYINNKLIDSSDGKNYTFTALDGGSYTLEIVATPLDYKTSEGYYYLSFAFTANVMKDVAKNALTGQTNAQLNTDNRCGKYICAVKWEGKTTIYSSAVELNNHTPSDVVRENIVSADCTHNGSYDEVIYCSVCNKEISRSSKTINATGHTEVVDAAVEATCTTAGKTEGKHCSVCNEVIVAQKDTPVLGHNYEEVTGSAVAATCTETGKEADRKCSRCDDAITGATIAATGHTEVVDAAVEATCIETGKTEGKHCSVCNEVIVAQKDTPVLGHNYEEVTGSAVAATCTEAGKEADRKCSRCNDVITGATIAATGHTEVVDVAVKPTCTETGKTEGKHCSVCNTVLVEQKTVDVLGHDYTVQQSDDKDHWKKCSRCDSIDAKEAHKWNDGEITTKPTTTSEGVKTFTCEVCKATKTESVAKLPSGGGVTPPKTDTITADVTGDKTSVKITAEISGDTASVAEIGKNDIDKAGAGVDITIDLTVIPNEVVSVTVTKKSLDNIYESKSDNVSIKLTESTVNMDRETLKNIIDQMKGSDLKLVVDKHQEALESMNKVQQEAVKDMREPKIMDAYFISGGVRITDFKGGSVDIKVPYPDKKGVKAWYVDDNGIKEPVPVSYDGKTAVITVNHFSHYVLEEDDSDNVEPVPVKKTVDKVIYVKSIKYSKKAGTKITFNKVSGADGYYVYGNRCNTDKVYKFKKLATLKGNDSTVFVHKDTAKNTFYKYYIKAYKVVDGKRVTISTSREIHLVTDVKGYKYGNPTKVTLSVKKHTLSKGKTFNLKNRVKVYSSKKVLLHTDKIRYVSSDSSIAKVNSKGKITAKKAGSCNVYAIAQNGRAAKIAVTVK